MLLFPIIVHFIVNLNVIVKNHINCYPLCTSFLGTPEISGISYAVFVN